MHAKIYIKVLCRLSSADIADCQRSSDMSEQVSSMLSAISATGQSVIGTSYDF